MKLKSLSVTAILIVLLSACGIGDLEDRIAELEAGVDAPIALTVKTKDDAGNDVTLTKKFGIAAETDYNYMEVQTDGRIYVEVYRLIDIDWDEYIGFGFYYNPATKQVEVDNSWYCDIQYYLTGSDWVWFGTWVADYHDDPNFTFGATVKTIDPETGKLDVTVNSTSTAAFGGNVYDGKAMEITMTFKGTVNVFVED